MDLKFEQAVAGTLQGLEAVRPLLSSEHLIRLADTYLDHTKKHECLAPKRSEFEIFALGGTLAHSILYDVSDPNRVEFKIVGEEMKYHFQTNPVGKCYTDYVPEERRDYAMRAFRSCAEFPCAMLTHMVQVFSNGIASPREALGVPLMSNTDPNIASHLLFVDAPLGEITPTYMKRTAFRFSYLRKRQFIDLGFGTPQEFEDMVLRDADRNALLTSGVRTDV